MGRIIKCVCMTCGLRNTVPTETGYCNLDHDNWLEYRDVVNLDSPYLPEMAKNMGLKPDVLRNKFMNPAIQNIIPKGQKLQEWLDKYSLSIESVKYRHQMGYEKRKGFDIVNSENYILVALEPFSDSDGNKWYVRDKHEDYEGPRYIKRFNMSFLEYINPYAKSFFRLNTSIPKRI